jgi:hypothetical protein
VEIGTTPVNLTSVVPALDATLLTPPATDGRQAAGNKQKFRYTDPFPIDTLLKQS